MSREQRAKSGEPAAEGVRERAQRVLRSQGQAVGLVDGMPESVVESLAAFTAETGEVRPSAVAGVHDVLRAYYAR